MNSPLQKKRLGQLRKQLLRLQKRLENQALAELSAKKRRQVIQRIERLYNRLSAKINLRKLPWVAASTLALGFLSQSAEAQSFAPPTLGQYGIVWDIPTSGLNVPHLVDIDADGDLDLFITGQDPNSFYDEPIMYYQENTGSPTVPNFGPLQVSPFGINFTAFDLPLPRFADMDNDGDYDLVNTQLNLLTYSTTVQYLENVGSDTVPNFAGGWTPNPFNLNPQGDLNLLSSLADLDGDGDLDALTYEYNNSFYYYYKNVGTAGAADYTGTPDSLNVFGLDTVGNRGFQDFVDFDGDGDLDAFYSDFYSDGSTNIYYQENIGSDSMPDFDVAQVNPFGLRTDSLQVGAIVATGDLDGDGNIDLIAGNYYGALLYYEQTVGVANEEIAAPSFNAQVSPNPIGSQLRARIETPEMLPNAQIRVLDVLGRTVHEEIRDLQNNEWLQIPSSDWPVGVYYLHIRQGQQQFSQSLRKQ